jgi:Fe-S oxidoreductase
VEGKTLGQLTYHDSCHLKRTLHAEQAPRRLLKLAGAEVKEMFECDVCCGMGGSYSVKLPEISAPMLQRKLRSIEQAGAPVVAMDCPGCVMQIRGGQDKKDGGKVQVRHTAELLAEALEGKGA